MEVPAVQVPLVRRDGTVSGYALVDAADAAWLGQWRWQLLVGKSGHRYATRCGRRGGRTELIYMHREILGLAPGAGRGRGALLADHVNGDGLDNRRSNLRVATRSQNAQNRSSERLKARYRGVRQQGPGQRWEAYSYRRPGPGKYEHIRLGLFDTPEEAARVAAAWRAEHMPFSADARAA